MDRNGAASARSAVTQPVAVAADARTSASPSLAQSSFPGGPKVAQESACSGARSRYCSESRPVSRPYPPTPGQTSLLPWWSWGTEKFVFASLRGGSVRATRTRIACSSTDGSAPERTAGRRVRTSFASSTPRAPSASGLVDVAAGCDGVAQEAGRDPGIDGRREVSRPNRPGARFKSGDESKRTARLVP